MALFCFFREEKQEFHRRSNLDGMRQCSFNAAVKLECKKWRLCINYLPVHVLNKEPTFALERKDCYS